MHAGVYTRHAAIATFLQWNCEAFLNPVRSHASHFCSVNYLTFWSKKWQKIVKDVHQIPQSHVINSANIQTWLVNHHIRWRQAAAPHSWDAWTRDLWRLSIESTRVAALHKLVQYLVLWPNTCKVLVFSSVASAFCVSCQKRAAGMTYFCRPARKVASPWFPQQKPLRVFSWILDF